MRDTGAWKDFRGKIWHVVQKSDGSVECTSNGSYTAAYKETWEKWKAFGGWTPVSTHNPEKEE